MRGPGWNYVETHTYGEDESDIAIVHDHNQLQDEQKLTVVWQDNTPFMYRWNLNGVYDIQLYH